MPPVEKPKVQQKPEGAYDYGSWRSIAAGTLVRAYARSPRTRLKASLCNRC